MYVRQIWQERKVGGFIAHSEGCGVTAALGNSFTFFRRTACAAQLMMSSIFYICRLHTVGL